MLKGIRDILKTIGEALTFADAGEMLSEEQKAEILDRHKGPWPIAPNKVPHRVVLAGNEAFSPEAVEHAIALCRENKAMLDLLYVSPEGSEADVPLSTVLPRLVAETDLDFQITRRHGDLLVVTDTYLHARQDTLMIVINVSKCLRDRAERYQRTGKWFQTERLPAVKLIDDVIHA
ncbi:MAG: hypothetical protein BMS9Abin26_1533 [Gammaproteobacteria bacterium]|nr:MAG: hypothetical protein BMS9Abin26_1533 [Gammaproteobacteria bacterium]